jgi:Sec-independent protein translocase protein TatA
VSGWAIASIVGGLLGILIVGLLVFIAKAVRKTTENAGELVGALEEVRRKTTVLQDLEAQSQHASDVVAEATAVLKEYQPRNPKDGDGRDRT